VPLARNPQREGVKDLILLRSETALCLVFHGASWEGETGMKLEQLSSLRMKILRSLTAMAAAAAALTIAAPARADEIDFYLNQPEGTNTLLTSPSVEVFVTENSSTSATVEFLALSGTIDTPAYINVNGTLSDINGTGPSASTVVGYNSTTCPTTGSGCGVGGITGPGSEDSFGTFSNGTGSEGGYTEVLFKLVGSGTNWTDAAAVLTPDGSTSYSNYPQGFEAVTAAQDAGSYVAPAPLIGHGLPGILAVAGVLFGAGLLERSRKRRSPGASISQAAA
jgi:hypothetical protein